MDEGPKNRTVTDATKGGCPLLGQPLHILSHTVLVTKLLRHFELQQAY